MHVWYFTFEYPPYFGGGLSTYMQQITEMHRERPDDRCVIFALGRHINGLFQEQNLAPNIKLIYVNPKRGLFEKQAGYWVGVSQEFARLAGYFLSRAGDMVSRFGKPDALEFADGFGIGYMTLLRKLALDPHLQTVPVIVTAHTPVTFINRLNRQPTYQLPDYWHAIMERMSLAACDAIVSPSRLLMEHLAKEIPNPSPPVHILRNPFRIDRPAEYMNAVGPRDHFYIASRLTYWKGIEPTIEAFKILWEAGETVQLRVYGGDSTHPASGKPMSEFLGTRYAKYIDLGLLHFEGLQPRADIEEQTRTAYAQLHPSLFDNFPYSVVEAMAMGRVCVLSTACGVTELSRDGEGLITADVTNPQAYAAALRRTMAMSEQERQEIGRNARRIIEEQCDFAVYAREKERMIAAIRPQRQQARQYPFLNPSIASGTQQAPQKTGLASNLWASVKNGADRGKAPAKYDLTVVIPYYNMGAFIDETLASVLDSTYPRCKALIVNDGSTQPDSIQRLRDIPSDYASHGDRVQIVTIPNGGVARARNHGVTLADTEFVALLDADDVVFSTYYDRAIDILRQYDNVGYVGCWIEDFNEKGRIRDWPTWNAEPPLQLVMNHTNCQSLVYRREIYMNSGMHDPSLNMFLDDWEGVISLVAAGHLGVMIPEPLFGYRIRANSIFRSNNSLWDINFEQITRKHSQAYSKWGAELVAFLNANGPNNFYHIAGKPSALQK